jgi:hypothetical protein
VKWLVFEKIKTIVKRILTKRINVLQATGVDEDSPHAMTVLPQNIDELACRHAIKIARQP